MDNRKPKKVEFVFDEHSLVINLKPCPFCGKMPNIRNRETGELVVECSTSRGCPMSAGWTPIELWNTRQTEIALEVIIQILKTALIDVRDNNFLQSIDGEVVALQSHQIARMALEKIGENSFLDQLKGKT